MTLLDILAHQELKEKFPDADIHTLSGRSQLAQIERELPDKLKALSLHQWDRLVEWGPVQLDTQAISDYANGKPGAARFISNQIRQPLIQDIAYQHYTVQRGGNPITVAEILVAHLYPDDLHLADIQYSNPDKPLQPGSEKPHQHYEGFGLLKPTLDRLISVAKSLDCRAVTLTAATKQLAIIFERHGFQISDTHVGRTVASLLAADDYAIGIPMEFSLQKLRSA